MMDLFVNVKRFFYSKRLFVSPSELTIFDAFRFFIFTTRRV